MGSGTIPAMADRTIRFVTPRDHFCSGGTRSRKSTMRTSQYECKPSTEYWLLIRLYESKAVGIRCSKIDSKARAWAFGYAGA